MKLLKFITMISVVLSLQGCMWQSLHIYDIERSIKICSSLNSEIHVVTSSFAGDEFVTCTNGTAMNIWGNRAEQLIKENTK